MHQREERSVLVMASHVGTRAAIAALLGESGLEVFLASGPVEASTAVARLAQAAISLDAIISEPEDALRGAVELIRQLRQDRPGLKIALVAGLGIEVEPPPDPEILVVRLPFETDRLLAFIDELRGGAAS